MCVFFLPEIARTVQGRHQRAFAEFPWRALDLQGEVQIVRRQVHWNGWTRPWARFEELLQVRLSRVDRVVDFFIFFLLWHPSDALCSFLFFAKSSAAVREQDLPLQEVQLGGCAEGVFQERLDVFWHDQVHLVRVRARVSKVRGHIPKSRAVVREPWSRGRGRCDRS
jgi:hypothetical protein